MKPWVSFVPYADCEHRGQCQVERPWPAYVGCLAGATKTSSAPQDYDGEEMYV